MKVNVRGGRLSVKVEVKWDGDQPGSVTQTVTLGQGEKYTIEAVGEEEDSFEAVDAVETEEDRSEGWSREADGGLDEGVQVALLKEGRLVHGRMKIAAKESKHYGKTFDWVCDNDEKYVKWLIRRDDNLLVNESLKALVSYATGSVLHEEIYGFK